MRDPHFAESFTFESVQFPGVFLRMDGRGVRDGMGAGGTVNCQFGAGPYERFRITPIKNLTAVLIRSREFTNVALRLDSSGVTASVAAGGGMVNCEYLGSRWARFHLHSEPGDIVSIESAAFRGIFLRMDGSGVTRFLDDGGGTVNCQFGAGPYEKFYMRRM